MSARTALISGASVAGPALAYWLNRQGWRVTVVERAESPRPGGYKVDLRGVAVEVVDRMGIGEAVRAKETDIRGGQWVSTRGKTVATLGPDFIGFRDPGDLEIMRGDLGEILFDATSADVEYVYGDAITTVEDGADGALVHFEHGSPRRFDIVVGADGLHSGLRSIVFGAEERYARPMGISVAVLTLPNTLGLDAWEMSCPAGGRTVNLYALSKEDRMYAQLFFPTPKNLPDRHDRADQEQALRDAFAGIGWKLPEILAALPGAPELYFDHLAQIEMDSWSSGRSVLIGDAGYCPSPASGQGTGLAVVGAYVLAQELAATQDHRAAFAGYERRMRPFVTINHKLGRDVASKIVPGGPIRAKLQGVTMRMLPHMPGRASMMESIMRPIRAAANAIDLDAAPVG